MTNPKPQPAQTALTPELRDDEKSFKATVMEMLAQREIDSFDYDMRDYLNAAPFCVELLQRLTESRSALTQERAATEKLQSINATLQGTCDEYEQRIKDLQARLKQVEAELNKMAGEIEERCADWHLGAKIGEFVRTRIAKLLPTPPEGSKGE